MEKTLENINYLAQPLMPKAFFKRKFATQMFSEKGGNEVGQVALDPLNGHVLSIHLLPVHQPCAIGKLIEDESTANVTEKWI